MTRGERKGEEDGESGDLSSASHVESICPSKDERERESRLTARREGLYANPRVRLSWVLRIYEGCTDRGRRAE